jgi:hypothetical protein
MPLFRTNIQFPCFNRASVGSADPTFDDLKKAIAKEDAFYNFNVLLFLLTTGLFSEEDSRHLLSAIKNGDGLGVFLTTPSYLNLKSIVESMEENRQESKKFKPWHCIHCTFINANDPANCEMCGLPKNG